MPSELERARAYQEQQARRCAFRATQEARLQGDPAARYRLELNWLPLIQSSEVTPLSHSMSCDEESQDTW